MKKKLLALLKNKIVLASISVCTIVTIAISSCTKPASSNDALKFAGTWTGTSCGNTITVTLVQTNNTTLTETGTVGSGTCTKAATITHTASGNNLTIPSQTFTDNCSNSYTISGSGSISGNTLTVTETAVVAGTTTTCTFVGTK